MKKRLTHRKDGKSTMFRYKNCSSMRKKRGVGLPFFFFFFFFYIQHSPHSHLEH